MSKRQAASPETGPQDNTSFASPPPKRIRLPSPSALTSTASLPYTPAFQQPHPPFAGSRHSAMVDEVAAFIDQFGLRPPMPSATQHQSITNASDSCAAQLGSTFQSAVPPFAPQTNTGHLPSMAEQQRRQRRPTRRNSHHINSMQNHVQADPSKLINGNHQVTPSTSHGSVSPHLHNFGMPSAPLQGQYLPTTPGLSATAWSSTTSSHINTTFTNPYAPAFGDEQDVVQSKPSSRYTSASPFVPSDGCPPARYKGFMVQTNHAAPAATAQQAPFDNIVNSFNVYEVNGNNGRSVLPQLQAPAPTMQRSFGLHTPQQRSPLPVNSIIQAHSIEELRARNRYDRYHNSSRPRRSGPGYTPSMPAPGFDAGPTSLPPSDLVRQLPAGVGPITPISTPHGLRPDPFSFNELVNIVHTREAVDGPDLKVLTRYKKGTWRCKQGTLNNKPKYQARIPKPGSGFDTLWCCARKACEMCKLTENEYTDLSPSVASSHKMAGVKTSESNTYVPSRCKVPQASAPISTQQPLSVLPSLQQATAQTTQSVMLQTSLHNQVHCQTTPQLSTHHNTNHPPRQHAPATSQVTRLTPPSDTGAVDWTAFIHPHDPITATLCLTPQPTSNLVATESNVPPRADDDGPDIFIAPADLGPDAADEGSA